MSGLSPRLAELIAALPLKPGLRVLEIGCGPGAAAREVARRIDPGFVLATDRSETAIRQGVSGSAADIAAGRLAFRCSGAAGLSLEEDEPPYDLAFAFRVGVLDGRHPEGQAKAVAAIRAMLKPDGRLFIDGGAPVREIALRG